MCLGSQNDWKKVVLKRGHLNTKWCEFKRLVFVLIFLSEERKGVKRYWWVVKRRKKMIWTKKQFHPSSVCQQHWTVHSSNEMTLIFLKHFLPPFFFLHSPLPAPPPIRPLPIFSFPSFSPPLWHEHKKPSQTHQWVVCQQFGGGGRDRKGTLFHWTKWGEKKGETLYTKKWMKRGLKRSSVTNRHTEKCKRREKMLVDTVYYLWIQVHR